MTPDMVIVRLCGEPSHQGDDQTLHVDAAGHRFRSVVDQFRELPIEQILELQEHLVCSKKKEQEKEEETTI